jgi:opacity protein-like surface antigen
MRKMMGFIFFILPLLVLTALVNAADSEDGDSLKDTPSSPSLASQEPQWGLALGLHTSYFRMQKNRGEIFRNITLLAEEQDYLPLKPSVCFRLSDYWGVELSYDHGKAAALNRAFDIYPEHDRRWTDGYLEWTPLMLSFQFRWTRLHPRIIPYILGGVSYTKTSWQRNDWYYYGFPSLEAYNNWIEQGQKPEDYPNAGYRRIFATDDHCYGTLLGLGVDYLFRKHWALNLDWRYHWARVNFTYTLAYDDGAYVVGRDGGTFILDAWILSLSLKYVF